MDVKEIRNIGTGETRNFKNDRCIVSVQRQEFSGRKRAGGVGRSLQSLPIELGSA